MGQPQSSVFSRSYNSFSGVDIKAVFGNRTVAELQAISYSITREKAPIYTMGSPEPRSFSRGKRGIAGTLVFIVFDRHAIISELGYLSDALAVDGKNHGLVFQSDVDDIRPAVLGGTNAGTNPVADSETDISGALLRDQALSGAWYVDQLPPFDVTLAAANEYGAAATMRIYGVELLNEGYGVSIDDTVSEQQFSYVARSVMGWSPLHTQNKDRIASQGATGS